MIEHLQRLMTQFSEQPWASLVVLSLGLLLALWMKTYWRQRLAKRTAARLSSVSWAVMPLLGWPATVALVLVWLHLSLPVAGRWLEIPQSTLLGQWMDLAWVAVIAFSAYSVLMAWQKTYVRLKKMHQQTYDATSLDVVVKVMKLAIAALTVLWVLPILGLNISALLAAGGVAGLVVGLAAKDLLANFFGGLMVYLDKPFKLGDWVRVPSANIEGIVEEMGWRTTCIRTFEKRPLYVPNSIFSSQVIENPSRMSHRRLDATMGLRYQDIALVEPFCSQVKALLTAHPQIDSEEGFVVSFDKFSDSSVDVLISCFIKTQSRAEMLEIKQTILLGAYRLLCEMGGEIAFPTRTLQWEGSGALKAP